MLTYAGVQHIKLRHDLQEQLEITTSACEDAGAAGMTYADVCGRIRTYADVC
jgi:hypothetical protein